MVKNLDEINNSNNTSEVNPINVEDKTSDIIIIDIESESDEISEDEDDYSYMLSPKLL